MAKLEGADRDAAVAAWARLEGAVCPECGADRGEWVSLRSSMLDDAFAMGEGGWFGEWYECGRCGAEVSVSRRFVPAGDPVVEVNA